MQATVVANKQSSDEKMKSLIEDLTSMITSMMGKIKLLTYSQEHKNSPKTQYPTTVFPSNKRDPPMYCVYSKKIGGMWTLKHEIRSPKFYELLTKIEFKLYTALDLRNFYNHIKMSFNALTRLL